jgi:hypothetical protein
MSTAFSYFNCTTRDIGEKVHNFNADTFKILLSNTAPAASNQVKADITEISAGNGYTAGGTAIGSTALTLSGSTATMTGNNVVFTASGGSMATFRYVVIYNSTASGGPLVGYWDYGSAVTLTSAQTFTIDLSGGILTITHP